MLPWIPAGHETKNYCAGEDHQQFNRLTNLCTEMTENDNANASRAVRQ
jgi:hypothetical protein